VSVEGAASHGAAGRVLAHRAVRRIVRALPRAVLVVGAVFALADGFAFGNAGIAGIERLLPVDALDPNPAAAVLSALGLAALAVGLSRGKVLAWWVAVATFAIGVPIQVVALGHPVGGMAAAMCLALLTLDRGRYRVRSARTWSWRVLALLCLGAAATVAEAILVLATTPVRPALPSDIEDIAGLVGSWLSFGELPGAGWYMGGPGILALALVARLAVAVALVGLLSPENEGTPDPTLRERVRQIGRQYGHGALLPFQLAPDKRWFSPSGREAVVAYGRDGRAAVAIGDPIGRPEDRWPVFAEFVDACRRHDWVPIVYQASRDGSEALGALGLRASPIGREAIIDLPDFSLAGSRRANLRHTIARARRGGVGVRWFRTGIAADDLELLGACARVDAVWRARAGREMGFTISKFRTSALTAAAVAVAVDATGQAIALATFQPTGIDGGWVLDLLRRMPGAVPGAMEWCVAEAAAHLRDEGASCLSLGLAPLSGLDPAGPRAEERALAAIARLVRPFYDVEGLAFFKDKYAPRWEPRFVAVPGRAHFLLLVVALARLHLGSLHRAAASQLGEIARALVRTRRRQLRTADRR
jgi:phosphatidylglycerol lysyltransferase